jgi:hypothetical protein
VSRHNKKQSNSGNPVTRGRFLNYAKPKTFLPGEKRNQDDHEDEDSIKTIPFFIRRNDFGVLLARLLEVSPTHRVCTYSKADRVVGNGFTLNVGSVNQVLVTKPKGEAKAPKDKVIISVNDWLKNINSEGETGSDIVRKASINYEGFGGVWTEEIRGKADGKRFYHINIIDSPKCLFKSVKTGGDAEEVYISPDWSPEYIQKIKPGVLKLNEWVKDGDVERRLSYLKSYSPLRDIYGIPPAIAALLSQHLELEIPSHNLEKFYTDFMPKVFFQFFAPDGMTDAAKEKFYKDLENTYTRKGGKRRTIFAEIVQSKKLEANVHEFAKQTEDGEFLGLTDKTESVIFKAHQWHPLLAGVPTPAGLGNSNLVMNIFHSYDNITIKPRQNLVLSRIMNPAFGRAGEWLRMSDWENHYLGLSSSIPVAFVGDLNVNKIFTKDEGREFLGVPKMKDEEQGGSLIDDGNGAQLTLTDPNDDPGEKPPGKKKQTDVDEENESSKEKGGKQK